MRFISAFKAGEEDTLVKNTMNFKKFDIFEEL
jgi:hypothetical protein